MEQSPMAPPFGPCPPRGRGRAWGGPAPGRPPSLQRTGIGVVRSTGTAVTLFCGEPSMTRSE